MRRLSLHIRSVSNRRVLDPAEKTNYGWSNTLIKARLLGDTESLARKWKVRVAEQVRRPRTSMSPSSGHVPVLLAFTACHGRLRHCSAAHVRQSALHYVLSWAGVPVIDTYAEGLITRSGKPAGLHHSAHDELRPGHHADHAVPGQHDGVR